MRYEFDKARQHDELVRRDGHYRDIATAQLHVGRAGEGLIGAEQSSSGRIKMFDKFVTRRSLMPHIMFAHERSNS